MSIELNAASVVLVTGGSGLLGHALRDVVEAKLGMQSQIQHDHFGRRRTRLLTTGGGNNQEPLVVSSPLFLWLSSKDADLRNYESVKALFEQYRPTHVVHLGAKVGGLFANMSNNIGFFRENMEINENVLKLCHEYKVHRALFCLSTCIFPAEAKLPLTEGHLREGPPHSSNEGYSMAKRVLEMMVRFHREAYKYDWLCVIPTNLYGPYDNFNLEHSHVLPGLLHKCYLAKQSNGPFVVSGSGKPLRQFVYNRDAGDILLRLVSLSRRYEEPNVILCPDANVPDGEVSIAALAKLIAITMEYDKEPTYDTAMAEGIFKKTASNSRLRQMLGPEFMFTPLATGVAETAAWFKEHINTDIRK